MYALQSQSLYGKILRQLNEFIVNRSRTNKNSESSQYNYNKLAFSIYNYAQLKKKTFQTTILYGVRMAVICFVYSNAKYNLITIIIIILTSVRSHLARRRCCVQPHLSISPMFIYIPYYGVYSNVQLGMTCNLTMYRTVGIISYM